MPVFFDNHSHISPFHEPCKDFEQVLSIDISKQEEMDFLLNNQESTLFFTAGLHPWSIHDSFNQSIVDILRDSSLPIIGIGECGLDAFIEIPMVIQMQWFSLQATIAEQVQKPLIIHCVKAFIELRKAKRELQPSMPWIIHGYSKNHELAKELLHQGFILSYGASLLNNQAVQKAFSETPDNALFLETDESDFSIQEIYQKAAEIKNIALEEMQTIINLNRKTIYGT